jgi:toxin ParE1/3/4
VTYRLHPEAALEHERQVSYYEEQGAGLGRRYHEATVQAIGKAVAAPQRFRISRPPNIRKISLQGFKFWVIYREISGRIQVLAIAHYRRHPDYWAPRA